MSQERTEAEALAQVLTISIGGEPVALRTLTIDESDAWLRRLTAAVDIELGETSSDADTLAHLMTLPARAALELVAAYDADGVLGDSDSLRTRMTKRELHDALEAMADAEDPFGEGAARLAAEVFGAPSRFLAAMTSLVIEGLASPTDASPSGASAPGASTGQRTSVPAGAANASSSAGRTATSANAKRRRSGAKRSRTGSGRATPRCTSMPGSGTAAPAAGGAIRTQALRSARGSAARRSWTGRARWPRSTPTTCGSARCTSYARRRQTGRAPQAAEAARWGHSVAGSGHSKLGAEPM